MKTLVFGSIPNRIAWAILSLCFLSFLLSFFRENKYLCFHTSGSLDSAIVQSTQETILACLAGIALLPGSGSCHEPTVNVLIDILKHKKAPGSALAAFESFVRTLFLEVNSNPDLGITLQSLALPCLASKKMRLDFTVVIVWHWTRLCFFFLSYPRLPPEIPSRLFEFQDDADLAAVISRYGPSKLRASALTHLVNTVVANSNGSSSSSNSSRIKALLILSRYSLAPEETPLVESLSETVAQMIKVESCHCTRLSFLWEPASVLALMLPMECFERVRLLLYWYICTLFSFPCLLQTLLSIHDYSQSEAVALIECVCACVRFMYNAKADLEKLRLDIWRLVMRSEVIVHVARLYCKQDIYDRNLQRYTFPLSLSLPSSCSPLLDLVWKIQDLSDISLVAAVAALSTIGRSVTATDEDIERLSCLLEKESQVGNGQFGKIRSTVFQASDDINRMTNSPSPFFSLSLSSSSSCYQEETIAILLLIMIIVMNKPRAIIQQQQ